MVLGLNFVKIYSYIPHFDLHRNGFTALKRMQAASPFLIIKMLFSIVYRLAQVVVS